MAFIYRAWNFDQIMVLEIFKKAKFRQKPLTIDHVFLPKSGDFEESQILAKYSRRPN